MLDKRCFALLDIVNHECQNSGYKVFSVEDLILSMPESLGVDNAAIFECITALSDREYISVKYQDDAEVCMCPLTKGRLVFENRLDEEIEKEKYTKRYFLFSFIGAFSGGVLAFIVGLLISLLGGINA